MGSAILDFSIVCQVLYFRKKNKDRPEAAALIQELVLPFCDRQDYVVQKAGVCLLVYQRSYWQG